MTEEEWLACESSEQMLSYLKNGPGRARVGKVVNRQGDKRKLRLLVVACAHRVWHLLPDPRSQEAVKAAERFADGLAGAAPLKAAYLAARDYVASVPARTAWAAWCAASTAAEAARPSTKQGFSWCTDAADLAMLAHAAQDDAARGDPNYDERLGAVERAHQADLLRDLFGNPFRVASFVPGWRTDTVVALAAQMYEARDFAAMPILGDALQDAECDNEDILNHCRGPNNHARGCWVVDLILGKS